MCFCLTLGADVVVFTRDVVVTGIGPVRLETSRPPAKIATLSKQIIVLEIGESVWAYNTDGESVVSTESLPSLPDNLSSVSLRIRIVFGRVREPRYETLDARNSHT